MYDDMEEPEPDDFGFDKLVSEEDERGRKLRIYSIAGFLYVMMIKHNKVPNPSEAFALAEDFIQEAIRRKY